MLYGLNGGKNVQRMLDYSSMRSELFFVSASDDTVLVRQMHAS